VLARDDGRWSLALPRPNQPGDTVGEALAQARISAQQWRIHQTEGRTMPRLTAFNVLGFDSRRYHDQTGTRAAARAGQFYPAGARDVASAVDMHMAKAPVVKAKPHRAVMLPHAGWRFCGDTIAKTIARVKVPDLAVVIGPNHTGVGPAWSVASHKIWELPDISVAIDTAAAEFIADRTPAMQCEANAHRMEHGTEVLLPFLHKANPAVRVVPIVLGHTSYEQTAPLAAALAELIEQRDVLLVISSDMNHFAPEPENRRLDHLALDAMLTGDPRKLYDTCTRNQISMCGMIPAVTIMQALLARNGKPLKPELIDYTNSAQATGDTTSVVGYAGVVVD
jgi:AmmeMemoRadiSam system protein B